MNEKESKAKSWTEFFKGEKATLNDRDAHPCANKYPNFTNATCCHSTKKLHKVSMKVWGDV